LEHKKGCLFSKVLFVCHGTKRCSHIESSVVMQLSISVWLLDLQ
jgi:hypothetical protein